MRVLLIGAGAVGQVYGYHFQSGGAEVTFSVRPKYRDQVAKGLALYRLGGRNARRAPVRFEAYETISSPEEVSSPDQVWLCVSSTALRKGDWIAPLAARTEGATWVMLQPGLDDRAYVERWVPPERLLSGMIPFVSYQGPLPGETLPEPGVCYWLPPLSSTPLSGPAAPIAEARRTLGRGGLRVKHHPDVQKTAAFGSAFLLSHMAALEVCGWSFCSFRQPWALQMAQRASREAARAAGLAVGRRPPPRAPLRGAARRPGAPPPRAVVHPVRPRDLLPRPLFEGGGPDPARPRHLRPRGPGALAAAPRDRRASRGAPGDRPVARGPRSVTALGYNTNGFAHHRLDDALALLQGLGYEGVALTLDVQHVPPFRTTDDEVRALAARLRDLGLRAVVETGARFLVDPQRKHRPSLCDEDAEPRLLFLERAVEIAALLDAEAVALFSGVKDADIPEAQAWERVLSRLGRVLRFATARGVRLGLEPEPGMLVSDLAAFARARTALGPELGLTLDLGHVACTEQISLAEAVRQERAALVNVHVEDIRGRVHEHRLFGEGDLDLAPALRALLEVGYEGLVNVELSRHSHMAPEAARRAISYLREAEQRGGAR